MATKQKVFIGADHNGFDLKKRLSEFLRKHGYEVVDEGDKQLDPDDDFPQIAGRVVSAMLASDEADPKGIIICGSGQGVCMAANRFRGIRASLVWNESEARSSRHDDDANVLCLAARELPDFDTATKLTETWLNTPFSHIPRYKRRLRQLDELN
jgi:ribose 5-phosphate isomerase B